MHRIYTKEEYLEKVDLLRQTVPNVSLGTDIIVGFPTETEEEFQETYDIFKQIAYSVAFIFSYSPRKGTPAFRWMDDIPEEVKQERLQRLLALHAEIAGAERQNMLGQEVEVLVDKMGEEGRLKARTRCWKNVVFQGDESMIGTVQTIKLHSFSNQTLIGEQKAPSKLLIQ